MEGMAFCHFSISAEGKEKKMGANVSRFVVHCGKRREFALIVLVSWVMNNT